MGNGISASSLLLGVLRIVAALLFMAHGLAKVGGFPTGAPPGPQALNTLLGIGGIVEIVTGLLIAAGFFTRLAAFVASGQMAVAYWLFHAPNGPWPILNQGELAILYCFLFLYLVAAGPGALSIDGARARYKLRHPPLP